VAIDAGKKKTVASEQPAATRFLAGGPPLATVS
jgi:hypothetical protein